MVVTKRAFDQKGRNFKMTEKSRVNILVLAHEELLVLIAYIHPESTICGFLYMMQYLTTFIAAFYSAVLFYYIQE